MYETGSNRRLQKRRQTDIFTIRPGSRQTLLLHQPSFPLLLLPLILLSVAPVLATPPRCLEPHPADWCPGALVVGHRYYFDPESSECLGFFHWGCDGENDFPSRLKCLETCMSDDPPVTAPSPSQRPPQTLEEICQQPVENYFCPDAYTTYRWFYNWSTGHCHMYLSFNCLSNGNTFSTEELCMSKCGKFSPSTTGAPSVAPSPSPSSHAVSTDLIPVTVEKSLPMPTHTSLSMSTHSSLKTKSTTRITSTVQIPTTTPSSLDQRPSIGAKTTPVSYKNIPTSTDESPQPTVQDIDTSSAPSSVVSQGILLLIVFLLVVQELY